MTTERQKDSQLCLVTGITGRWTGGWRGSAAVGFVFKIFMQEKGVQIFSRLTVILALLYQIFMVDKGINL